MMAVIAIGVLAALGAIYFFGYNRKRDDDDFTTGSKAVPLLAMDSLNGGSEPAPNVQVKEKQTEVEADLSKAEVERAVKELEQSMGMSTGDGTSSDGQIEAVPMPFTSMPTEPEMPMTSLPTEPEMPMTSIPGQQQ